MQLKAERSNNEYSTSEFNDYKLLIKPGCNSDYEWYKVYEANRLKFLDTLLIVVPAEAECDLLTKKIEKSTDFLRRFESSINRVASTSSTVPLEYSDFIESKSEQLIQFGYSHLRVFLFTKPESYFSKNNIVIPDSISSIQQFDVTIEVLRDIENEISRLYASEYNLNNYVRSITKKDVFRQYSTKFQEERLIYIQTRFEIESKIYDYKQDLVTKIPYGLKEFQDKLLLTDFLIDNRLYPTSVIATKNREFEKLIDSITYKMQNTTTKDSYVADYLRDYITTESMWTNIKIQKILKLLTIFAVIIGIISCIVTIFSYEIQKTILSLFK